MRLDTDGDLGGLCVLLMVRSMETAWDRHPEPQANRKRGESFPAGESSLCSWHLARGEVGEMDRPRAGFAKGRVTETVGRDWHLGSSSEDRPG